MQMRHLRYFVAAAEAGSFLKAAGRLHVAQPALSRQIRDLEREVGLSLFERLPRGVRLTPAGDAFLAEARNSLACAARAVATARHEGASDKLLRVAHGALFHYARTVSDLLAEFRYAYPDRRVTIQRMGENEQRAALNERRIDVAISFIPTATVPGFHTFHLVDAKLGGVLLPASHPAAALQKLSLHDLKDLVWVRVSPRVSPELYEAAKAALWHRGLSPVRQRARPRDSSVAAMYVAAGDAWMLANEDIGRMFTEGNPAIVYRPFSEPPIPCWVALLSLCDAPSPNIERLIDIAQQRDALREAGTLHL